MGRKIIAHVAPEEVLKKSRHQAALVLGHELAAVHLNIIAVPQDRQGRGIGRRPADAQLLELFHQTGFRKARRRLGEHREVGAEDDPIPGPHRPRGRWFEGCDCSRLHRMPRIGRRIHAEVIPVTRLWASQCPQSGHRDNLGYAQFEVLLQVHPDLGSRSKKP